MRASRFFIIFCLLSPIAASLASAQDAQPEIHILGRQGSNHEGTRENPFSGQGIALGLEFKNVAISNINWNAGWGGSFCREGNFQFFGAEGFDPTFVHKPVKRGVAQVEISAVVFSGPDVSPLRTSRVFFVAPHPRGCPEDNVGGPGNGTPSSLSLRASPTIARFGETINLVASASDSDTNSLTFLFYASSSSNASDNGTLIGTKTSSGCTSGCAETIGFQASNGPATHFFRFEASDGQTTVSSSKIAVQVTANGGGGGGGGGGDPSPPAPEKTFTVCQQCESQIDAGPPTAFVVGGRELALEGDAIGPSLNGGIPVPGGFRWMILDNGGLNQLEIRNFTNFRSASLLTPEVEKDTVVRIGLEGTFNACSCMDEMVVTILAQAPPEADISISKNGPQEVKVGDNISYTLEVQNHSSQTVDGVVATDILPPGTQHISSNASQGTCKLNGGFVQCDLGSLRGGAKGTITVTIRSDAAGDIVNNATVASQVEDPQTANNSAQAFTSVLDPAVDLAASMTAPEGEVHIGADLVYRVKASNRSNSPATGVVVQGRIPNNVEYVGSLPSQGSCGFSQANNNYSCTLGTLDGGQQVDIDILTRATDVGEAEASTSISANEDEQNPSDNQMEARANVTRSKADIRVEISSNAASVSQNDQIDFNIRVLNLGPQKAGAVTLVSDLAAGFVQAAALSTRGSCTTTNEKLECNLGSLDVNEEVKVTLSGKADGNGIIRGAARAESGEEDPVPANNSDETDVSVVSLDFAIVPHSTGLADTFVSLAVVNMAGGPNEINIQGLDSSGRETGFFNFDASADLEQSTFLTGDAIDDPGTETLFMRGNPGRIHSFFMMGSASSRDKLDGVGGAMPISDSLYFLMAPTNASRSTCIYLYNPGLESAESVELDLIGEDGSLVASSTISIAGQGSFRSHLRELFGQVSLDEGYVRVSSDRRLRGFELVSDDNSFAALTARTEGAVRRLLVPHFAVNRSTTTIVRILNLNQSNPATGTIQAFDDSGKALALAQIEIGPGELGRFDIRELFSEGQLKNGTGYLDIGLSGGSAGIFERTAQAAAAVSFQSDKFHAALPISESGRTTTFFLHVAQDFSRKLFQGLALLNSTQGTATGVIEAFDSSGNPTAATRFKLGPGERFVDLLSGARVFGSGFAQIGGHLRISSDTPVFALTLFGDNQSLASIDGLGPEEDE